MAVDQNAVKAGAEFGEAKDNEQIAKSDTKKDDGHFAEKVEVSGVGADKNEIADDVD